MTLPQRPSRRPRVLTDQEARVVRALGARQLLLAQAIALLLVGSAACGHDGNAQRTAQDVPSDRIEEDSGGAPQGRNDANDDASVSREAVFGELDLKRPPAPPDAGTSGGHRGPAGVASTSASRFSFTGSVTPKDAEVRIDPLQRGRRAHVTVGDRGRFRAEVGGLRPGINGFELTGTRTGHHSWKVRVEIRRR